MYRFFHESAMAFGVVLLLGAANFGGGKANAAPPCDVDISDNIQHAIDNASPGDVICLSGTFVNSHVVVSEQASNITIRQGTAPAIIEGPGTGTAFLIDGASGITISNLEIHNYGIAVELRHTTRSITIEGNKIFDVAIGTAVQPSNARDVTMRGNEGSARAAAFAAADCTGCIIAENKFSRAQGPGLGAGVWLTTLSPDHAVRSVTVRNNEFVTPIGALILSFPGSELSSNTFNNNHFSNVQMGLMLVAAGGDIDQTNFVRNDIQCDPDIAATSGIVFTEDGGEISGVRIVRGEIEGCQTEVNGFDEANHVVIPPSAPIDLPDVAAVTSNGQFSPQGGPN